MKLTEKTVMLACDFETTVYDNQTYTEVWAAAYARLFHDKVTVLHSLPEFLKELIDYRVNVMCWFHNERFDGTFIVNHLLKTGWEWTNEKKLKKNQFKTLISKQNRWYSITLFTGKSTIEIRDSAKLMPMTLRDMGKAFNTLHRKKDMEYKGYRYAGCKISSEEMEYIINDVLVLKESLEFMIKEGHTKLTIGGCALDKYKTIMGKKDYVAFFPQLTAIELDPEIYQACTAEEYIRKSYRGGFCYLRPDRQGRQFNGRTFDVNSLYPSVMHSVSGNRYPTGYPHFWVGDIPESALKDNRVFFITFKCSFELKKDYLPTLQIKGRVGYNPREWLSSSRPKYRGKYCDEIVCEYGSVIDNRPVLTMTSVDWYLFHGHYDIYDMQVLHGCWFYTQLGLFDDYINHWMERKENAETKGMRTEAKLFLNNLYGKFSTNTDASYREPVLLPDGSIDLIIHEEINLDKAGYIAVGTMVTSYARHFTITHGQMNYSDFIYADTDSLHLLDGDAIGIATHPTKMLHWKLETEWSSAIFIRQKTYAEFCRKEDGEKVEPHWIIKCAGMPEGSKKKFLATHPITDFKYGLCVGGKLTPKRIAGGIVLKEQNYTLHRR